MLFLVKRSWATSLLSLVVLAGNALLIRQHLRGPLPIQVSARAAGHALIALAGIGALDLLITGLILGFRRDRSREAIRRMIGTFEGQPWSAMVCGSLQAGLGEEWFFRGLGVGAASLASLAVLFGLMHHLGRDLWMFTLWAIGEGLLFALAAALTGNLFVAMLAHGLHDLIGFMAFRWVRHRGRAFSS